MKEKLEKILKEHSDLVSNTQNKIEDTIESYKNNRFAQKVSNRDLASMIKEETDKILEEFEDSEKEIRDKSLEIINEEKEIIIHMNLNNSTDYAVKINNALSFLNATGDELNDDNAHMMLEDFERDYKTMSLFKQVIENKNGLFVTNSENPNETKFPKTFENYNNKQKCFNVLDELTKNFQDALKLFKREQEFVIRDGDPAKGIGRFTWNFEVPSPGYNSLTANDNITNLLDQYEQIEI